MRIAIASDHAGFELKLKLAEWLKSVGQEVVDFGTDSAQPCDYPDFCHPAAFAVASGNCERGIVIGGSGNGEAMVANRHSGVRCALCYSIETASLARKHNNANMISLGARMTGLEMAMQIVGTWLDTDFEAGRHIPRISKIELPNQTD